MAVRNCRVVDSDNDDGKDGCEGWKSSTMRRWCWTDKERPRPDGDWPEFGRITQMTDDEDKQRQWFRRQLTTTLVAINSWVREEVIGTNGDPNSGSSWTKFRSKSGVRKTSATIVLETDGVRLHIRRRTRLCYLWLE